MPTIKRFEELVIWQIARDQAREFYRVFRETDLKRDFELWNQLNASSGSVMDNIAEGFDRYSRAEFRQFLVIARGSNAEARSQLYRIVDRGYLNDESCTPLIQTATNLSVKITNLINHLQQSDFTHKPVPSQSGASESTQDYSTSISFDIPADQLFLEGNRIS